MENLPNKTTEEKDSGLIKALAIAFPEEKIYNSTNGSALKLYTTSISNEQFANLNSISELYKKEIYLWRTAAKICIQLTDAKEVSNAD